MSQQEHYAARQTILPWESICKRGDRKFARALIKAGKRGKEIVHAGTFKDERPFSGKFIRAEPMYSGCSSAALACAEIGADGDDISDLVFA